MFTDSEPTDACLEHRAWAEDASFVAAQSSLEVCDEDAEVTVQRQGVARIPAAVSADTTKALRAFVLKARDAALERSTSNSKNAALANAAQFAVLGNCLGMKADVTCPDAVVTRRDVRLPLGADCVTDALHELLSGPVGDALEKLAGADAVLWELSAMVCEAGACPQPVHADSLYTRERCVYTAFLALQNVSAEMGPTRFFPGSHRCAATHDAWRGASGAQDAAKLVREAKPVQGLLDNGDVSIHDSRTLHCGAPNICEKDEDANTRVLFYLSFASENVDIVSLERQRNASIRPHLAKRRITLAQLRANVSKPKKVPQTVKKPPSAEFLSLVASLGLAE
ncbi:hypothetical protein M885DRAFT_626166 [Pelagophyceae sp. CCMP2097]|nr:hypothetical protein M885DRAFT_626166 [Pelagophyceae sp. CCMP2097]